MKESTCPELSLPKTLECNCDYFPPTVKTLLIKKTKSGKIKVKINGKGKWINAEFNREAKTVSFYS